MASSNDNQYVLAWSGFNTNLSTVCHKLLYQKNLVDVTLAAEGLLLKAHRLILSASSPYFEQMFATMPVNQHAFVILKDVSFDTLKDLIQYIYAGEVRVEYETVPELMNAARALQIKGLSEFEDRLPPSMPESNVQATEIEERLLLSTPEPNTDIIEVQMPALSPVAPPPTIIQPSQKRDRQHEINEPPKSSPKRFKNISPTMDEAQPLRTQTPQVQPEQITVNENNGREVSETIDLSIDIENTNSSSNIVEDASVYVVSEGTEGTSASTSIFVDQTPIENISEPVVKLQTSKKGNTVANINGYVFYKVRSVSNVSNTKYRCRLYRKGCQAVCTMTNENNQIELHDLNHNHDPHTPSLHGKKRGNKPSILSQNEPVALEEEGAPESINKEYFDIVEID